MQPLNAPSLFSWGVALPRLSLSYGWLSCCLSSLPPLRLCLSFVTACGIVCRRSRHHVHPVRRLLPQNGSGATPNIAISVVVVARFRRQCVASPAIAIVARTLVRVCREQGASLAVAVVARVRHQGVDDEQCPGNTAGVGPKSKLCEPVVLASCDKTNAKLT